jgi:hypothetical protein
MYLFSKLYKQDHQKVLREGSAFIERAMSNRSVNADLKMLNLERELRQNFPLPANGTSRPRNCLVFIHLRQPLGNDVFVCVRLVSIL